MNNNISTEKYIQELKDFFLYQEQTFLFLEIEDFHFNQQKNYEKRKN